MSQCGLVISAFPAFMMSQYEYTTVELGIRRRNFNIPVQDIHAKGNYRWSKCQNSYRFYRGLYRHIKYECGKLPRFRCPYCIYLGKHRSHVYSHINALDIENDNEDL